MEWSGQLNEPAALLPGKEVRYPLARRLGGPQNRSGCGSKEKIIHRVKYFQYTGCF
jgi:hypothetical protein